MDEYLTVPQAAALLRLSAKRVQTLARLGRLPAVRVGRKWLLPRGGLLGMLHGRTPPPEEDTVEISARNQLRGKITAIALGGVMAEVRVGVGAQEIAAVITRSSVDRLGLKIGDEVVAVIKATEVMIGRP